MSKLTRTEEKYLNVLYEIYSRCEQGGEFNISYVISKHRVSKRIGTILNQEKIIVNTGSRINPMYQWKSIKPNVNTARKIIEIMLKQNKNYIEKSQLQPYSPSLTKESVLAILEMREIKKYSWAKIAKKTRYSVAHVTNIYNAVKGSEKHLKRMGHYSQKAVNEAKQELNSTIVVPPRMLSNKVQENKPTMEHRVIEKPTQKSINILWGLINIKF